MTNSVYRAILILELLVNNDDLTASEISRRMNCPKSSIFNILKALEVTGIVERDPNSALYRLGLKLFELGHKARGRLTLTRIANPYLQDLNRQTSETIFLTILDNDEVLYVDCVESLEMLRTAPMVGLRAPLYCTGVGKAIFAFLSEAEQERIINTVSRQKFTKNTITLKKELRKELAKIRKQGYAVDNEEHGYGVRCVAAPIFNKIGEVFASISISGPAARIDIEDFPRLSQLVMTATAEISDKLL